MHKNKEKLKAIQERSIQTTQLKACNNSVMKSTLHIFFLSRRPDVIHVRRQFTFLIMNN